MSNYLLMGAYFAGIATGTMSSDDHLIFRVLAPLVFGFGWPIVLICAIYLAIRDWIRGNKE